MHKYPQNSLFIHGRINHEANGEMDFDDISLIEIYYWMVVFPAARCVALTVYFSLRLLYVFSAAQDHRAVIAALVGPTKCLRDINTFLFMEVKAFPLS